MPQRTKVFFLLLFFVSGLGAQIEKTTPEEVSLGFNANTNGSLVSGFNFRYTLEKEKSKFDLYSIEVVNVKHELEDRFTTSTNSSAILGKIKYLLPVRLSYGKEITLFQKYPENGLRLNWTYSAGPSIGIVKPYMIRYPETQNGISYDAVVPFDPKIHDINQIKGDAGMLTAMNLAKLNLGAHARSSLNFEYGSNSFSVAGIEAGATLEAFLKSNVIMMNMEKRFIYSAFFVHLYYGIKF